jgi:pimeloyl-ACP methyl ester carboxylesterase
VYLVGHDYGAAVALKLAHRRRERIAGLVLYEPTPFGLLLGDPESRYVALDIAVLRRVLGHYVEAGDWFRAALRYVDHRSGPDAWQGLSTRERAAIAWRMPELCAQLDAQVADRTPLAGFARIDVPVRLLTGDRTRVATERIELLAGTLPRAEWRRIDGPDWMGPDSRPQGGRPPDRGIPGATASELAPRSGADGGVRAAGIPVSASHMGTRRGGIVVRPCALSCGVKWVQTTASGSAYTE